MSTLSLYWVSPDAMSCDLGWDDLSRDYSYWRTVPVLSIPYTGWGDYSGDTVTRANYECLEEMDYRITRQIRGDFGSGEYVLTLPSKVVKALGRMYEPTGDGAMELLREYLDGIDDCDIESERREIAEIIEGLEDYPCIDDERVWFLEKRIRDEDWDDHGWEELQFYLVNGDRVDKLNGHLDDVMEAALCDVDGDDVYSWIVDDWDRTGWDWGAIETATSAYFRTKEIARDVREYYIEHGTFPWDKPGEVDGQIGMFEVA